MPPERLSAARWFFRVLEKAMSCVECRYYSPYLITHFAEVQTWSMTGELIEKMLPGESLKRNSDGEFAYIIETEEGVMPAGFGQTAISCMLAAFQVLMR